MLDLDAFATAVQDRRSEWERQLLVVEYHRGAETPKPAAWVRLRSAQRDGQLTVWVSGEAEMDSGPSDGSATVCTSAQDVTSGSVGELLDELAARVLTTT